MASVAETVQVCVWGAGQPDSELLLHRIAAGDLLGKAQKFQLMLCDSIERLDDLCEKAADLTDACYPLLIEVKVSTFLSSDISAADIVLILMPTTCGKSDDDYLQLLQNYATVLNNAHGIRYKAVVVAGEGAAAAAGILNTLAPHLAEHLVVAVDTGFSQVSHRQHGGYHLAKVVCSHLHSWWTGVQETGSLVLGVGFHGIPSMPHSSILPVPVSITSPLTASTRRMTESERHHAGATLRDFLRFSKELGLTETGVSLSHVFPNL